MISLLKFDTSLSLSSIDSVRERVHGGLRINGLAKGLSRTLLVEKRNLFAPNIIFGDDAQLSKFEIKDLSMGHFIKVKEDSYFTPAADQETGEQGGNKTAPTRKEDAKVLAKLAKAEVWSVLRTLFRLGKVEGLDDLTDTPFMVHVCVCVCVFGT